MPISTKTVIKDVELQDLKVGDRILHDIVGYKDRPLFLQGKFITNRDVLWLRKKLKEQPPKLATERYRTGGKAPGRICAKNGAVLVKAGETITDAKLHPLLQEGFQVLPAGDGESNIYHRANKWTEDRPYRIEQFNPRVRIETMVHVNEDGSEAADPRGEGATRAGGERKGKRGAQATA